MQVHVQLQAWPEKVHGYLYAFATVATSNVLGVILYGWSVWRTMADCTSFNALKTWPLSLFMSWHSVKYRFIGVSQILTVNIVLQHQFMILEKCRTVAPY